MRFKVALLVVAARALLIPSATFAHRGHKSDRVSKFIKHELNDEIQDRVKKARDHRFDRRFDHNGPHQKYELGAEALHLAGWGLWAAARSCIR